MIKKNYASNFCSVFYGEKIEQDKYEQKKTTSKIEVKFVNYLQ